MAMKAAVPSVLTLVPIGSTKRTILVSMPNTFSVTRKDTGRVAALQKQQQEQTNKLNSSTRGDSYLPGAGRERRQQWFN